MPGEMTPCIHQITLSATMPSSAECVVALGFFDGVHTGHLTLLRAAREEAKRRGLTFAVFTFSDCGDGTYKAGSPRLTEWNERMELLRRAGVECVYAAEFQTLAPLSPEAFVRDILRARCRAACAVCGFNFRFGYRAAAGEADLRAIMTAAGGDCIVLPAYHIGTLPVSSTAIREAVEAGDIERANEMLGRPFSINFPVIHGKMLGRSIGVPTINQAFPPGFIIPRHGVYACLCTVDGVTHPAVSNVGVRPTVECSTNVNCESHILDFNGWLYGRRVRIAFIRYLREENRFPSLDALVTQIKQDICKVRDVIGDIRMSPPVTPDPDIQRKD